MSDVRIAYLIVIGLILVLAAIVNVGAKKIGRVIRIGGSDDEPHPNYKPEDDDELCENGRRRFQL